MSPPPPQRPLLALAFTVVHEPGHVRLVAGEDFRYTLSSPGLEHWLPAWLPLLDGGRTLDQLLTCLPARHHADARRVVAALYGERVLIDGPAPAAAVARDYRLRLEGEAGALAHGEEPSLTGGDDARAGADTPDGPGVLTALCQDRLDWDEALRFNRRRLAGRSPWGWVSSGAMTRGYVGPVFLPDAGPCLECLVRAFRRLSPAPELYDALLRAARDGQPIRPVPFPAPGAAVLRQLLRWKRDLLSRERPPAAVFQLHVLEVATLEVSAHRVFVDPECPACRGRR